MGEAHEISHTDTIGDIDKTKFIIFFDYICESDPIYSMYLNNSYINAYIIEIDNFDNIMNIFDIDEHKIDMTDTKNSDLISRLNSFYCSSYFSSYDIARHNMIYKIYFDEYSLRSGEKLQDIYAQIKNKFSYTGKTYYYDTNGNILKEFFHINGNIEGKFIGYCPYKHTQIYEIDYVNGKIHGKYIKTQNNGRPDIECTFIDGIIDGKFYQYYNEIQIAIECTYVDGKIHGDFRSFHPNGEIAMKCTYVDGKIEGEYMYFGGRNYNDDIIEVMFTNYANGVQNGIQCIYNYSLSQDIYTLKSDCDFVNGRKHGIKNIYNKKGEIVRTITYEDDMKNGLSTYMGETKYGNGYYIKIEKTYKNDKRDGINKYYNELGQLEMTKTYKNDRYYNITYYYSTAVKKQNIKIIYNDRKLFKDDMFCTKKIHITRNYNESGDIISRNKETKIIYHDSYEVCDDSEYYDLCQDNDCPEYYTGFIFKDYQHFDVDM